MTKFKKILATIMATASFATTAMGLTAYAAKENFNFDFNGYGGLQWSLGNEKDDDVQIAYIHPETGYITSDAYEYFTLYKDTDISSSNKLSDSVKITSLGGVYTIPYTTYRGTGSTSYIAATGSYYASDVQGYWYA